MPIRATASPVFRPLRNRPRAQALASRSRSPWV
ncbi:Uncharacterised protein [Bordetella pertussis]|nr:Uncharacterised protein [Bordetella pertussis]CFP57254.1 Uncharacterised protein [Bordetella pertussis]CFW33133.1 Uncharacterised protein [Bordetella pertussis]